MFRKILLVLVIGLTVFAAACADEDGSFGNPGDLSSSASAVVVIDSINPATAAPGDTVTIIGEGLNPDTDMVLIGKKEIEPVVAEEKAAPATGRPIGKGLVLKGQQEESGDGEEGEAATQMAFVVPSDTPAGPVAIRVSRDGVKSNSVTLTVKLAEANPNEAANYDDERQPGADDAQGDGTTSAAGTLKVTPGEKFIGGWSNTAVLKKIKISWSLPANTKSATLYIPVRGDALYKLDRTNYDVIFNLASTFRADSPSNRPLNYLAEADLYCIVAHPQDYGAAACTQLNIKSRLTGELTTIAFMEDTDGEWRHTYKAVIVYIDASDEEQRIEKMIQ